MKAGEGFGSEGPLTLLWASRPSDSAGRGLRRPRYLEPTAEGAADAQTARGRARQAELRREREQMVLPGARVGAGWEHPGQREAKGAHPQTLNSLGREAG